MSSSCAEIDKTTIDFPKYLVNLKFNFPIICKRHNFIIWLYVVPFLDKRQKVLLHLKIKRMSLVITISQYFYNKLYITCDYW